MKIKIRNVGCEAPAVRVKMDNGETKVIGMMADKVQVFLTLPFSDSLKEDIFNIIKKYEKKSLIYIICSQKQTQNLNKDFLSSDFKDFASKMGLLINDELIAKSIFIIDKDGIIVYKELLENPNGDFDNEKFDKALDEAIKFKKKGHTHENWMGV